MSRKIREVLGAMTPFPHHIDWDAKAGEASRLMNDLEIRHLPVVSGTRIVGLLSRRELDVAALLGGLMESLSVKDLCVTQPYVVDASERLDNVVEQMSERRIGSAIVVRDDKLIGILTTTDVCRILAETLREGHAPSGGDEAA
ncbi:MAG: CBS domain-containing protein [Myxococcota bacterium]